MYICICVYVYICIYVYMYMCICIHIYTHTQTLSMIRPSFRPCLDDGRIVAIPQRPAAPAAPAAPCYPAESLTTNSRRGANFAFSEPPPEASDCANISFVLYALDEIQMEIFEHLSSISEPYKGSSCEFQKVSSSEPTIRHDSERNANLEQRTEFFAVSSC